MSKYLVNSYSLNMLADPDKTFGVNRPISKDDIPRDVISAIGHADTAAVVSADLGLEIPPNRVSLSLKNGDKIYVAQYIGPRLPEGATQLPEGAEIKYFSVTVYPTSWVNWQLAVGN